MVVDHCDPLPSFRPSGLRYLKWQADVAACGPIRCRHEYTLAGIGVPMVTILLMLAAVFSSSHSARSVE